MKHKRNWIIGLVLSAAATVFALQNVSAPNDEATSVVLVITPVPIVTSTDTPAEAPVNESCAFMWATHDNPQLSTAFEEQVKAIDANAIAHASGYGEDCIYADGTSTFLVMQTDFYVRLPVTDLANEDELGNFAARVMESVLQIPRDEIPGPNYGFVEFQFEQSEAEHNILRIPIQQYITEAQGMTGAELTQKFSSPP